MVGFRKAEQYFAKCYNLHILRALIYYYLILSVLPIYIGLCPKVLLTCKFHSATTTRTSGTIPMPNLVTTTIQAKSTYLTAERRSCITDNATYNQRLKSVALGTTHRLDMLAKEAIALIDLSFITACCAEIFALQRHI